MVKSMMGERHGILTVVSFSGTRGGKARWLCLCKCGRTKEIDGSHLRTGEVKSCGCLRRRHGHSSSGGNARPTPTWRTWHSMIDRCLRPGHNAYPRYGGKGITVCERWRRFENFLADMGERPEGKTLDRHPNRDGNYEPGNCRWATASEQNTNKNSIPLLTIGSESLSVAEWSRRSGIARETIRGRLLRGVPAADAVFSPPDPATAHAAAVRHGYRFTPHYDARAAARRSGAEADGR